MNDYMRGRGLNGPTVDLGAQLEWIREPILSSVRIPAASCNYFDRAESSDSKIGEINEVERPADGGTVRPV